MESSLYKKQKGRAFRMIKGAVLGSPISHSLSPQIHNAAYNILQINAEYSRYDVKSGELAKFLLSHPEMNALSLTMPLKEEALLVADFVSPISNQIQSGNTLSKEDGKWRLTSTDVEGFTEAFVANGVKLDGSVLILGSGATARAVASAIDSDRSINERQIHIVHRNPDRESAMRQAAPSSELVFHGWSSNNLLNEVSLVINTSPAGAADVFCADLSKPAGVYFEALYNPWPTALSKKFNDLGRQTIDGIELLVHQAISQIEIFTGVSADRKVLSQVMRSSAIDVLRQSTDR
jgi:shikimate dehydrogenase